MMARRTLVGALAAGVVLAVCAGSYARAADNPRGLDPDEEQFGRPIARTLAVVGPVSPLAGVENAAPEIPHRGNPLWGISIKSLHVTRERPLFSPSRRPPMSAAIAAPPPQPIKVSAPIEPDRPGLDLVGVVVGGGEGVAVFLSDTTHDIVRLKTGEGENGWILRSVNDREVVLEKDHRTAVVRMPSPTGEQK